MDYTRIFGKCCGSAVVFEPTRTRLPRPASIHCELRRVDPVNRTRTPLVPSNSDFRFLPPSTLTGRPKVKPFSPVGSVLRVMCVHPRQGCCISGYFREWLELHGSGTGVRGPLHSKWFVHVLGRSSIAHARNSLMAYGKSADSDETVLRSRISLL